MPHIAAEAHEGPWTLVIRFGPLIGMTAIALWAAAASRIRFDAGTQDRLRTGTALSIGLAGMFHLGLTPSHFAESAPAGVFFAAAGASEIILAGILMQKGWVRPAYRMVIVVAGGLVALYAATRIWALPWGIGREEVDPIGLLTKFLEIAAGLLAAAGLARRSVLREREVATASLVGAALMGQAVLGLGSSPGQVVAVIAAALAVASFGRLRREQLLVVVSEAAAFGLLVRSDRLIPFLVGGAGLALMRVFERRFLTRVLSPLAVALLAILSFPQFGARLEIMHLAHPEQPWAFLIGVVTAAAVTAATWAQGGLPTLLSFYAFHLSLQGARLAAGRTVIEAIEVPAASLGLVLIAALALAGPAAVLLGVRWQLGLGALAGLLDVVMRDQGI
ncbi:MAG: hypothetical protein ACRDWA_15445, partial [Acidimicrobiia bacterium]